MKKPEMLHIFRNTPLGRETLMMSAYFSKKCRLRLQVYLPRHDQFLMYFDEAIATIELDRAFLRSPETARAHAEEILNSSRADYPSSILIASPPSGSPTCVPTSTSCAVPGRSATFPPG